MRSWRIRGYGTPLDKLFLDEVEKPEIKNDEVLIAMKAAAFNPIDFKILRGDLKMAMPLKLPAPIGFDVSGEVVDTGSEVTSFKKGDQVFCRIQKMGTMAEYVKAQEQHVAFKPTNISHEMAAGIPLAGLTAYQSLYDVADLKKDEQVLIQAGSGGVGSLAVQLAKTKGAYVVTTTSSVNKDWVQSLGPDQVIDYTRDDYSILLKDFDLVFDTLGGEHIWGAFKVLKDEGKLITIAGEIDKQTAKELKLNKIIQWYLAFRARKIVHEADRRNILYRYKLMTPNGQQLQELTRLIEENKIRPVVDSVFPFEKANDALQRLTEGRAKGKIIVSMSK